MPERYARFPGPSDPPVPPHRSPHGSVNCTGKQSRYQPSARCLICGVVSVPQKTRFDGKTTSVDFVRLGKASKSDPYRFYSSRCAVPVGPTHEFGKGRWSSAFLRAFFRQPSPSRGTGRCPVASAEAVDPGCAWRSRRAAQLRPRRLSIRSEPRCSGQPRGYDW
jgi:hypothetical protein